MFPSSSTVTISFSSAMDQQKYKLIEVSPALLNQIEQESIPSTTGGGGGAAAAGGGGGGGNVVFHLKGAEKEEAVLCTAKSTFSMKRVETSNTVYVVPHRAAASRGEAMITGRCHDYYELKVIPGKVDRLLHLLPTLSTPSSSSSSSSSFEGVRTVRKDALEAAVLASREEIDTFMLSQSFLPYRDHYLYCEEECSDGLVLALATAALAQGWPWPRLVLSDCLAALPDWPSSALLYLFLSLGREEVVTVAAAAGGGEGVWVMDDEKIGKAILKALLRKHKCMRKDRLYLEWSALLPGGVQSIEKMSSYLPGLALVDTLPQEQQQEEEEGRGSSHLLYFPASALPLALPDRLAALYAVKDFFSATEVEPYLLPFFGHEGQPQTVEDLLLLLLPGQLRLVDGLFLRC